MSMYRTVVTTLSAGCAVRDVLPFVLAMLLSEVMARPRCAMSVMRCQSARGTLSVMVDRTPSQSEPSDEEGRQRTAQLWGKCAESVRRTF